MTPEEDMNESEGLKVINKMLKISFILLTGTISTNNYFVEHKREVSYDLEKSR